QSAQSNGEHTAARNDAGHELLRHEFFEQARQHHAEDDERQRLINDAGEDQDELFVITHGGSLQRPREAWLRFHYVGRGMAVHEALTHFGLFPQSRQAVPAEASYVVQTTRDAWTGQGGPGESAATVPWPV